MEEKISAARLLLYKKFPYLRSAIMTMRDVRSDKLPFPAAVDQHWRMYYNPAIVEKLNVQALALIVLHELMHCIFNHAGRYGNWKSVVSNTLWNIAADLAVWSVIQKASPDLYFHHRDVTSAVGETLCANGAKAAPSIPTPESLSFPHGLSVEEYLELLLKSKKVKVDTDPGGGSCSDGIRREWEDGSDGGVPKSQIESARRRVAEEIAKNQKDIGNIGDEIERLVGECVPKKSKTAQLARAIYSAAIISRGGSLLSWSRPSRRRTDMYLPSTISLRPKIVVLVDTSGSMGEKEFVLAMQEILGICRDIGQCTVYAGDTNVKAKVRVTCMRQKVPLIGGGGTDVGNMIDEIIEKEKGQFVLVVITDGYTPWNERVPRNVTPVILLTAEGGSLPDWAKYVIHLKE